MTRESSGRRSPELAANLRALVRNVSERGDAEVPD
jgi:hypothetical protein